MKSIFYTFLLLVFSSSFSFSQSIPNGGFENWITETTFDSPPPYDNINFQTYLQDGVVGVTQVQGMTGSAVRLESVEAGGDIYPGVIGLIDFENDESGGIPFSSNPDSVRMNLRYDIPMGDTAAIILIFTKNGNITGYSQFNFTGEQTTFNEFTFNIPPILGIPDSLLFIASSSSLDDPVLGGYIEIDDLVFTDSNDQLPNNDFETWDSFDFEDPEGWSSFNIFQTIFEFDPMVSKTSDAVIGNSAVRIETVETIDFDEIDELDTVGFLASGDFFVDEPSFGLDVLPTQISGYYKFASVGMDSASVALVFTKFNSSSQESEPVAAFNFLLPVVSDYTSFEFPLNFPIAPDSVFIAMAPYNLDDDDFIPLGNVLFIDELSWDLVDGTKMPILSDALQVYPNPASDFIFIKTEPIIGTPKTVELTDGAGRVISIFNLESLKVGEDLLKIDVGNFDTGMYYYKIVTDEMSYAGKVMIRK